MFLIAALVHYSGVIFYGVFASGLLGHRVKEWQPQSFPGRHTRVCAGELVPAEDQSCVLFPLSNCCVPFSRS